MALKKLAILTIILLLISGCQQSQTRIAGPVDSTDGDSSGLANPSKSNDNCNILFHPKKGKHLEKNAGGISISTASDAEGIPRTNPPEASQGPDQDKIDKALELCNHAQKMWEQGNLEEALSNLDNAYYLILELDSENAPEITQQKEDIRFLISKRILEIYASRQIVASGPHNEIPVTLNTHVNHEIKRLTGPEKGFFIRALERSARYRPMIVSELKKSGLPEEISWLPLIESGFQIRALSPARALGLWQFIPSTGYKFGLSRNYYIDERMDPVKSTRAAIAYLKELHELFGDWATALAAYNCGEGRVLKLIRNQKINYLDNFWDLYQSLPRETARYVPRFLATLHIINNLEAYDICAEKPLEPLSYKTVEINRQLRLKDIAKATGIPLPQLKDLNPELRYELLPAEPYSLKIPHGDSTQFVANLEKVNAITYSPPPAFVYHRVRRGETLSGIADRYHTSVKAISRANRIGQKHTIIAGKLLKIPNRTGQMVSSAPAPARRPAETVKYKVKQGDNLWLIANRFSTSTRQIMAANGLKNTNLTVGQSLVVPSGDQKPGSTGQETYRVQSGDSPFLIAKKHNMSLDRLLSLNRLNKRSKIYPGQKLIIE